MKESAKECTDIIHSMHTFAHWHNGFYNVLYEVAHRGPGDLEFYTHRHPGHLRFDSRQGSQAANDHRRKLREMKLQLESTQDANKDYKKMMALNPDGKHQQSHSTTDLEEE